MDIYTTFKGFIDLLAFSKVACLVDYAFAPCHKYKYFILPCYYHATGIMLSLSNIPALSLSSGVSHKIIFQTNSTFKIIKYH